MKYKEHQRFRCWDLKLILGLLIAMGVVKLINGDSRSGGLIEIFACLALLGGAFYLLQNIYFKIKVNRKGIKYKHQWWKRYRKIAWEEIERIEVSQSTPTASLSGWSVAFSTALERHSLVGQSGLKIHLKTGDCIFLGLSDPKVAEEITQMTMLQHI